ncbi:hypothetical protein [Pseudomonas aeruginosa]|uniref:hypothetical protein n=1 Tax=Pseudomonas aeruginosa TaxID=287 RepID=UPI001495EE2D|nr:hypothetical protein [Pseudomonas aeruginosa]NPS81520.1 hypothetical protein [Pseudomonas aeruginosa]
MSIDWNKAPEGTTHYHIAEDINPWRKIEGTVAYEHYRGKWLRVNSFNEGCMPGYYVPIPQETWDGQGLPPVGTVCEACWNSPDEYYQIMVLAHGDGKAIYRWLAGPSVGGLCESFARILGEHSGPHPKFRPIRTPEKIAAQEREKAIDAMLDLDPPHESGFGMTSRRQFCEVLFDAGYRRQESST